MNTYVLVIIWLFFIGILFRRKSGKNDRIIQTVLLFFPIWVLHAFADGNSIADTPYYLDCFTSSRHMDVLSILKGDVNYADFERGFTLFNALLSRILINPQWSIFIIGTIIVTGYATFIYKYSPVLWLSVFLFFISAHSMSLFVLRQFLSVSICLFSIPFIIERKFWYFLVIVLFSYSIHSTALIFFPLYFIYTIKINKKFFIMFTIGTIILMSASMYLVNFLIDNMSRGSHFNAYLDVQSNYTPVAIAFMQLLLCVFCLKVTELKEYDKLFFLMMCIYTAFEFIGTVSPLGGRTSMIYAAGGFVMLPRCIQNSRFKMLFIILIVFCFSYMLYKQAPWDSDVLKGFELISISDLLLN